MYPDPARKSGNIWLVAGFILALACLAGILIFLFADPSAVQYSRAVGAATSTAATTTPATPQLATLDIAAYNAKLEQVANEPAPPASASTSAASSTASSTASTTLVKAPLWPVKTVYPEAGAILPFHRIVAYYGNFYSTAMGVLGEYPPAQMLQMLQETAQQWQEADPSTPVIPAIDYIAVTAQGSPGADGMYRARMPASQIDEAISLANQIHGLVILDVQVGDSTLPQELPPLAPYLAQSNVELAIDPEFAMHNGAVPGSEIGSYSASDINYAANFLANIVEQNNLPPKILIVHRFTQDMVTDYQDITPLPQVEIVMDMDGWGSPAKKINTYKEFIEDQPVQFTGFKLFYKNDLRPPSTGIMTPQQVLELTPQPLFIQYQ